MTLLRSILENTFINITQSQQASDSFQWTEFAMMGDII